jgi:hypothetical protein
MALTLRKLKRLLRRGHWCFYNEAYNDDYDDCINNDDDEV